MKLQDVTLYMRERDESVEGSNPYKWVIKRTSDLFAGKKVLVVGLPGAFTPTCSNNQLPGFEARYDDFKKLGVDEIYCTAVNDAFTMFKWSHDLGISNVKMLPDGNTDFARAMNMLVSKSNLGFGDRSWRYVALIDNLNVVGIWEEEGIMNDCPDDPYEVTTPENIYNIVKSL